MSKVAPAKKVTIVAPPAHKEAAEPPSEEEDQDDGGLPPLSKEEVGQHEIFKNLENAVKFYCRKNNLRSDPAFRQHLLSYFYACHYCPTFFE